MKNLLVLNTYFFRYKWYFLLGIFFVIASNYFAVLIPQEIRKALDYVQGEVQNSNEGGILSPELTRALLIFTGTVILFALLKGVMMYFMRQTIIVMSRLIEYDMRRDIYNKMQVLDTAYYKRNRIGDLMSRITDDVDKVRMYLGPSLLYGINLVGLFTLTIYAMLSVSVKLSMYTLLPLPILSISIYYVSKMINERSSIIQKQLGLLTSNAQEVFSGITVLKSYVKEDQFYDFFDKESNTYKEKSIDLARVNALFFPLMILLVSISSLLVVYIGGREVMAGRLTSGNIAEFIIYVNMLTWPVTSIGWIASLVQQAEASQKRINELMDHETKIVSGSRSLTEVSGKLHFDHVSFAYPDTGIEALKDISFSIEPGQRLAILGRTASGKSTIAELLLRMYDVSTGEIRIDDVPIVEYDVHDLRRNIGYVPQDVFLFSDTIRSNVNFGVEDQPIEEIVKYTRAAAIHNEIEDLPNGYDTRVGERGVNLSGGQKQRISIARALIKKPQVIILDDSLSAVDTDTEKRILDHLNDQFTQRSVIMITHRIHSIVNFDHIIVLDEGRIVQQGKHEELLSTDGYYKEMYDSQQIQSS